MSNLILKTLLFLQNIQIVLSSRKLAGNIYFLFGIWTKTEMLVHTLAMHQIQWGNTKKTSMYKVCIVELYTYLIISNLIHDFIHRQSKLLTYFRVPNQSLQEVTIQHQGNIREMRIKSIYFLQLIKKVVYLFLFQSLPPLETSNFCFPNHKRDYKISLYVLKVS